MTTPAPDAPFLDPNNPLAAGGPARLDTGVVDPPGVGRLGVVTVRTPSTTCMVLMNPDDIDAWAAELTDLADRVRNGAGLVRSATMDTAKGLATALDAAMPRRVKSLHWGHARVRVPRRVPGAHAILASDPGRPDEAA